MIMFNKVELTKYVKKNKYITTFVIGYFCTSECE